MTRRHLPLTLLACLLALPAAARSWESDAFRANERRAGKLLLLPPSSSITRAKVNDAEPLFNESGVLEAELARAVAESLRGLGYEVDTTSASVEQQNRDRDLQAAVARLEARVAEVMPQVANRPKDIRDGRYTVEDAGLPLREATGAEAVLIVESQTIIPSKGVKALGAILGGAYYNPTQTQAIGILVDLRSGVIDTVMVGSSLGAAVKRPGKVAETAVTSMLSGYPRRGEAMRVKASRRGKAAAADRRGDADADDASEEEASVLAEFESLRAKRRAGTVPPPEPEPAPEPEPEDPAELVLPSREFQASANGASVADAASVVTTPPAPTTPMASAPTTSAPTAITRSTPTAPTVSAPTAPTSSAPTASAPTAPAASAPTAPPPPVPTPAAAAPPPRNEPVVQPPAPPPPPPPPVAVAAAPPREAPPVARPLPPEPAASPVRRAPAPSTAAPPPPADDPEARALYQSAPPSPAVDVAFTGGDGGPGVILVNGTGRDVRVSVAFRPFIPLGPGATARVDVARGTAWILVTDPAKRELARAACTVGENSLVTVDLALK